MKVVVDYRPALRQRSGVGEYIHHLIGALVAGPGHDDDVALFSSSLRHPLRTQPMPGARTVNRRVPVRMLNWLWHRWRWPPIETVARGSFDVAHSPHPLMLPARAAAQVVTIHDLDFLRHPSRARAEVKRDYPLLVREHAIHADHVIVNSAHTAGEVNFRLDVPRGRITVCRAGAPPWQPRTRTPDRGHLLFIGTLEPRKNVGGLLDAYQRLLLAHPAAPDLVLAGAPTPAAAGWLSRIRRAPLHGHVRHLGYVSDAVRRQLYDDAAVLVLPSFNEGFGLPVLEAMTVGVPVVASARGALPEVLGDAGLLVEPDDPDAIADSMARLLFDTRLAAQASARGVRRSLNFSWRDSAAALHDAYRTAVAARRERQRGRSR